MKELTTRKLIRRHIRNWFKMFDEGHRFTTDDCCRYVNRYMNGKQDTGTIKREMRFLRVEKLINYRSIGERREKIIQIIK